MEARKPSEKPEWVIAYKDKRDHVFYFENSLGGCASFTRDRGQAERYATARKARDAMMLHGFIGDDYFAMRVETQP